MKNRGPKPPKAMTDMELRILSHLVDECPFYGSSVSSLSSDLDPHSGQFSVFPGMEGKHASEFVEADIAYAHRSFHPRHRKNMLANLADKRKARNKSQDGRHSVSAGVRKALKLLLEKKMVHKTRSVDHDDGLIYYNVRVTEKGRQTACLFPGRA